MTTTANAGGDTKTGSAPEGHDNKMQQKVDDKSAALNADNNNNNNQKPQRPANVPEKFWDAEAGTIKTDAVLASYAELEKRLSNPKPDDKNTDPNAKPDNNSGDDNAALSDAELTAMETELTSTGQLSEDSYAKLEKAGVDREFLDTFIAGRQALAAQFESEVLSPVGGREAYDAMVEWAAASLTPAQIAAHNKAVNGSKEEAQIAIAALQARYVQHNGKMPDLVKGDGGASGESAFRSVEEHKAAIRDPRYKTDPAYRKDVEAKLSRSQLYGA